LSATYANILPRVRNTNAAKRVPSCGERLTVFLHCWAPFVAIVICLLGTRFAYVADDRRPESVLIAP